MRYRVIAAALALGVWFWSPAAAGQTPKDIPDVQLFDLAYKAVDAKQGPPRGRRVVAVDDPLLRTEAGRRQDVLLANSQFASVAGLSTVALKDVLVCTTSCSFKDDIVASASFRMASRLQDSAVVHVATRFFAAGSATQYPRWQMMALHEVYLARRNRAWTVVGVSILTES